MVKVNIPVPSHLGILFFRDILVPRRLIWWSFVRILSIKVVAHQATSVSMPMWPGEGLTFITYHRNAAHLFVLAFRGGTAGDSLTTQVLGDMEKHQLKSLLKGPRIDEKTWGRGLTHPFIFGSKQILSG